MPLVLNLLLGVGFAAAVGAAVHFWRIHLEAARRDDMQALAARRGWALTVTEESLGRAGTLRIVPRGGLPWVAEVRPLSADGGPFTAYAAEAPRWAEGTLLLLAIPAPDQGEPSRPAEPGPQALREVLAETGACDPESLRLVPAPEGVTALSDADPSLRVDLGDLALVLGRWTPVAAGPRGLPVMILSPDGLQLRLCTRLRRPEQMERFLDLAMELSRLIGP